MRFFTQCKVLHTHSGLNLKFYKHSGQISAQPHTFVMHTYFDSIQIVTYLQNIVSGNGKTAVD